MRLAGNGRRDATSADTTQDFKTVYCPHGVGGGACAHPSSVKTTNRNNNKYDPGSQDGGADQAGSVRVMPVSKRISPVGASLLAKAVYQQTMMSTDTPYSRAGSLPQVLRPG
ncbi:hypothetical protein EMIT0P260_50332 [Pseudomonas sp. IT-P260]